MNKTIRLIDSGEAIGKNAVFFKNSSTILQSDIFPSLESLDKSETFSGKTLYVVDSSSAPPSNKLQMEEFISNDMTEKFLGIVRTEECEPEYTSQTEIFIFNLLKKNKVETMNWLNKQFLKNFKNKSIIVNILIAISHIPYEWLYPNGPTMTGFAITHESIEVKENAIRVFEKWGNEDSLQYLEAMGFDEKWLQDYLTEVIMDIKEGIAENVSVG
jgi:hypothetical protein